MKNSKIFISILLISIALIASCSKKIHRDDAIRIKSTSTNKYNHIPKNGGFRNANTLRGEVVKIEVIGKPIDCPATNETPYDYKTYILFIDSAMKSQNFIERIPLEDVDLVGIKISDLPKNEFGNINFFETYNEPLLPLELREVPVDTIKTDTCNIPCPCKPIDLSAGLPCLLCFDCPERDLKWWFAEVKGGIGLYNDISLNGIEIGKDDWLADIAVGLRFGESKRWGLGLMYSTNVETMNLFDTIAEKRPMFALYGRYDLIRNTKRIDLSSTDTLKKLENYIEYDTVYTKTYDGCGDSTIVVSRINPSILIELQKKETYKEIEVRPCINPFIYGLLGGTIDKFSIDLFSININEDCQDRIDLEAPGVDISMPIDWGIGAGLEFAITRHFDLSMDLGIRSISYGDKSISSGLLIPKNRRLNALVFRIGLTF